MILDKDIAQHGDRVIIKIKGELIEDCEVYEDYRDGVLWTFFLHNIDRQNGSEPISWYDSGGRTFRGFSQSWALDESVEFIENLTKNKKIEMRRKLILGHPIGDYQVGEYNLLTRNEIAKLLEGGAKWEREWSMEDVLNDDVVYYIHVDGSINSLRYKHGDSMCEWLKKSKNLYETEMSAQIARQKIEEGEIVL